MSLPDQLRDLAAAAERGALPETALVGLERAAARAERDRWLAVAAHHAGGCAGLLRALARELWRVEIWLKRDRMPSGASPLQVCLYNAAEACGGLPTARQLQRILRHAVSVDLAETEASQPEQHS